MSKKLFFILMFASLKSFAYSVEYAATALTPVTIKFKAPEVKGAVRLNLLEKKTGKIVSLTLADEKAGEHSGTFLIYFEGMEAGLPVLELRHEKGDVLYVVARKGAKYPVLHLFTSTKDALSFEKKNPEIAPKVTDAKPVKKDAETLKKEAAKAAEAARAQQQAQEKERLSLEAQEAMKREEMMRKQAEMTASKQALMRAEAQEQINKAMDAYGKGQYTEATSSFARAIELDPTRDDVYYKYGVSLYKAEDFNKSLAVLSMAEGGADKTEYTYFLALNHMKLKEYDKAHEEFVYVRDEKDSELSAPAAYFAGTIDYNAKKYADARANFEFVLDHSKDPQMDKRAEEMIEEIDKIENFQMSAKERFRYTLTVGASYDGNVLNIAAQNLATDTAAYRANYAASFLYKLYQSYKSDFSVQALYSDVYSVDTKGKASATLQAADPLQLNLSLPYRTQFESSTRGYLLNVTPSFTSVTMSAETSERKQILTTGSVASDISFQLNAEWLSAYRLQLDSDTSYLTLSAPDDNQSASRVTVGMTQTRLLDPKGAQTLGADLSYAMNKAQGKNSSFNKAILGVIYGFPAWRSSQGSAKLEYTDLNYNEHLTGRKESSIGLTVGAAKSFNKNWALILSAQYLKNDSNIATNVYDKWVFASGISYTGSILSK